MLLPGTYALTASHSNKFGRLEADITHLEVLAQPGQGAVRKDLVLKLKVCQTFTVTTITTGPTTPHYQEELSSLFKNCDILNISRAEKQYVKLRELILTVTVLLNKSSLAEYCSQHYYDNRITRLYSAQLTVSDDSKHMSCL